MHVRPLHPLHLYLLERGVGVAAGAALIGISERMLRDVLAGKRRLIFWRELEIASDLGVERDALFPPAPAA